ncbi:MAG: nitronate monooxygenase [Dehalococcoidia bacterium]|nr:MAG: nitronate monooxygenase [Dehalococcoidia bacterium]
MPALKIGQHTARIPIVQGGMAVGISLAGLASAVANAGGIGVIGGAGIGFFEPDFSKNYDVASRRALRNEIKKARQKTQGVLGINIMVALTDYAELVKAAADEGIDIIFCGAGLPLALPGLVDLKGRTRLVPIVSSARAARIICKKWLEDFGYLPDGFVVEGPLAGGHLGFKPDELELPENRLEKLVPSVIQEVQAFVPIAERPIPVIAGGGIFTGADIYKFIRLGASGVQIATRFVVTEECDASPAFKEAYLKAKKEDVTIIKSPVGMPGRAINNAYLDDVKAGKKKPFRCYCHCVKTCNYLESPYCIFHALVNAQRGHLSAGFAFCGANVYRLKRLTTVQKLFASLGKGYSNAARREFGEMLARFLNDSMSTAAAQPVQV